MTTPHATDSKKPPTRRVREKEVPAPNTPEGELFHYTWDEAAPYTPFSARTLRDKAYRHEIEHVGNGRDKYITGRQIVALSQQYIVEPLSTSKPARAAA